MKKFLYFFIITFLTIFFIESFTLIFFKSITGVEFDYHNVLEQKVQRKAHLLDKAKESLQNHYRMPEEFHPYFGSQDTKELNKHWRKCTDSTYNIAILGGSVACSFSWYCEKQFQDLISKSLNDSIEAKNIRLIELCAGGFKQPQQLFELLYFLLNEKKIDLVLNIDGYNELVMAVINIRSNTNPVNPSFAHMSFLNQKLNQSFNTKSMKLLVEGYQLKTSEVNLLNIATSKPFVYSSFISAYTLLKMNENKAKIAELNQKMSSLSDVAVNPVVQGPPNTCNENEIECAVNIWEQSSLLINMICNSYNIPYYHFLQPNQYYTGSKTMSENEKKSAFNPNLEWSKIASKGYPLLVERGNSLQKKIHFHDLTGIYKNIYSDIYSDDCCHYNEKGYEILGIEMAKKIRLN